LQDKAFYCIGEGSEGLATLGVVTLPPLVEEPNVHRIQPRSANAASKPKPAEPKKGKRKPKNATERMNSEHFNLYETIPVYIQDDMNPGTIIGVQTVFVFLYLLVFSLVMFIRTADGEKESFHFTVDERAQLHAYDYIPQQEEAKLEREKTVTPREQTAVDEDLPPEPVRQESSAPPSDKGISSVGSPGPSGPVEVGPSRSTTTTTQTTLQPATSRVTSSAENLTISKLTEDHFVHVEDAIAAGTRKKPEEHSIGSMEVMEAAAAAPPPPTPPPAPRKLFETEASGVSPDVQPTEPYRTLGYSIPPYSK
ncbi:hypothetical protein PMAYCL1PPCAC_26754, partial [Pristionchus mayeri]